MQRPRYCRLRVRTTCVAYLVITLALAGACDVPQAVTVAGEDTHHSSDSGETSEAGGAVTDVVASEVEPAPAADATEPISDPALLSGKADYDKLCALCHGDAGQGYVADGANALSNQDFLVMASDEMITRAILRGRPGTPMAAWGEEWKGPLSQAEAEDVTRYIRSWQREPSVTLDAPLAGDASAGDALYKQYCASCHGTDGHGGTHLGVANPEFLASVSDGYLARAIRVGRRDTPMASYEAVFSEQELADLVALIRSWAQPPSDEPPPDIPQPDNAVLNPGGPEPPFNTEGRYVSVDMVHGAYSSGAEMVLLDARPPADAATGYIPGAISVPFYEVTEHLDRLPKDVWIVAYCACPHAESGVAYEVLMAEGYERVRVMDEGFDVWEERGYPVTEP